MKIEFDTVLAGHRLSVDDGRRMMRPFAKIHRGFVETPIAAGFHDLYFAGPAIGQDLDGHYNDSFFAKAIRFGGVIWFGAVGRRAAHAGASPRAGVADCATAIASSAGALGISDLGSHFRRRGLCRAGCRLSTCGIGAGARVAWAGEHRPAMEQMKRLARRIRCG
jgi:hypothetical protein